MKRLVFYIVLLFAALSFIYPFIWMISASLAPESEIGSLVLFPNTFTLDSYTQMFSKIPIGRALFNSILVSTIVTFGVLVFGSMVGYALSKLEFKGRELIFYIIIFIYIKPNFI
jgi:multiple sugar transport system permease protein